MRDRSAAGAPLQASRRVDRLIESLDSVRLALPADYGDADDELRAARDHLDIASKILLAPEED